MKRSWGRPKKSGKNQDNSKTETDEISLDAKKLKISKTQKKKSEGTVCSSPSDAELNIDPGLRCGKILRLKLKNFMCHSNLTVELKNRVNLVAGNNGSGKSAILMAVMVGLGAKAHDTSRCKNLIKLIQAGQRIAKIEIEIANDGPNPYDPVEYGRKITVVRQISQSSTSLYKIKSELGRIVSQNRDDLSKILLHFNIQIDNPIFMLTQDSARNFLKDLDPKKNYDLFLKATLIDTVLEKLNACFLAHKKLKHTYKCRFEEIDKFEAEIEELKRKQKIQQSREKILREIALETIKLAWSKVVQQESKVSALEEALQNATSELQQMQNKIDNKDLLEESIKLKIETLEEELIRQRSTITEENQILRVLEMKYNESKENYEKELRTCERLEIAVKNSEESIADLELEITQKQKGAVAETSDAEETISSLNIKYESLVLVMINAKIQLAGITDSMSTVENDLNNIKYERQACLVKIDDMLKEVNSFQESTVDTLAVYGRNIKVVREQLDKLYNAGELSELPRGPFGHYINVLDPKWLPIIEQILGCFLHTFIVDNDKDRTILDKLFTEFKINAPIITTRFQKIVYDVSEGCVTDIPGTILLMNAIKCDDPVVLNCLIDKRQIEAVLLTEDQQLAIQLTAREQDVPKNLFKVIVLDPLLEYIPAPLYRIYSLDPQPPKFLQVKPEEKQMQLILEIKDLKEKKSALENRMNENCKILADLQLEKNSLACLITQLETEEESNINRIEKLRKVNSFETCDEHFLFNELQTKNSFLTIEKYSLTVQKEECERLYKVMLDEQCAVKTQTSKIEKVEQDLQDIISKRDLHVLEITSLCKNVEIWKTKHEETSQDLKRIQKEKKNQIKFLEDLTAKATEKGECVQNINPEENFQKRIGCLNRQLKKIRVADKTENLEETITELIMRHKKRKSFVKCLFKTITTLENVRIQRYRVVENLINHLALMVMQKFSSIMKLDKSVGVLNFDHIKRELKISTVPRYFHLENAASAVKCLSGGERSYATVSFLIALWSCVEQPFFFLDEYDVFTDEVNRELITKMLFNEAKQRPKCQYVLFTPQNISTVRKFKDVNIIKLADP